jgi:CRP-like cAMP-binding protein
MTITEYIQTFVDKNYKEGNLPFKVYKKKFKKNEIITDYSKIETKVYYLELGICQLFVQKKDEEDKILDFFLPGEFFSSYVSLLKQKPSDTQITALTKTTVLVLSLADIVSAYKNSLLANKIGRVGAERLFMKKVKRERDLLTKTAEARYLDLLRKSPNIISQVPLKNIAMYLGIKPESLSRIRKRIIS